MSERKNYIHRWLDGCLLAVHTATNPSAAEWDAMIATVRENRANMLGTLVYTEGGSPSALQRKQLRDAFMRNGETPPSAVLTNSAIARAAITALNLFMGGQVKAFLPNDIEGGLSYLGVSRDKWPLLRKSFEELKRELGINTSL